jgi:hypothetical protein
VKRLAIAAALLVALAAQADAQTYTTQDIGNQQYTTGSDGSHYTTQTIGNQQYTTGTTGTGQTVNCTTQFIGNQQYTTCN